MLYNVDKQTYKFKSPKKLKFYNIFYILLLKQDITRKKQVNRQVPELNINNNNSKEYKIEKI